MTSYKIARQAHLGRMLTHLQQKRYPLVWRGEYLVPAGDTRTTAALWWIALPGQVEQWYDTREAERLVSGICLVATGVVRSPVRVTLPGKAKAAGSQGFGNPPLFVRPVRRGGR
ncbi:hypothetical protein [Streptomyces sp. NPDC057580]|uniref:hypothetical protein n=1 Tax=Streptomyces sp. NPDC057580 TaxID=3346173 RepID=UPI0036CA6BA5